jgi:hypothetical protein
MLNVNMLPASEIPEESQGMPPMFGPMMARSMRFQQMMSKDGSTTDSLPIDIKQIS